MYCNAGCIRSARPCRASCQAVSRAVTAALVAEQRAAGAITREEVIAYWRAKGAAMLTERCARCGAPARQWVVAGSKVTPLCEAEW